MGNPESLLPICTKMMNAIARPAAIPATSPRPERMVADVQISHGKYNNWDILSVFVMDICKGNKQGSNAITRPHRSWNQQINSTISKSILERVGIFCGCQELACKSNIFCCWIWDCKTQWREAGLCTMSCWSCCCGSEFMLIAAERREAQVTGLGGTKEILKLELRQATDTQAAYYVMRSWC